MSTFGTTHLKPLSELPSSAISATNFGLGSGKIQGKSQSSKTTSFKRMMDSLNRKPLSRPSLQAGSKDGKTDAVLRHAAALRQAKIERERERERHEKSRQDAEVVEMRLPSLLNRTGTAEYTFYFHKHNISTLFR
jgi:hypothetical protein